MENIYILHTESSGDAVVIDPGGREKEIVKYIRSNNLNLHAVLATHGHADHILSVASLQDEFGVPLFIHEKDDEYARRLPQQSMMLGLGICRAPGKIIHICSEEELEFGNLCLKVFHTPGHTPGGVVFKTDNEAFVGDTIFAGSVGRTDLPGGNMQELLKSIQSKLMNMDDSVILHPGHGEDTTVGEERRTNPFINQMYPFG